MNLIAERERETERQKDRERERAPLMKLRVTIFHSRNL